MNKQQPKTNTSLDKYPGSEMTVKAMIRKEAIECIRGFMGQLTKGCQEAIMTAIPELHKSEDETHRKWILEYLYDGLQKADEQFKDHFKSAINWLEKQKPAEWSEEDKTHLGWIIECFDSWKYQVPEFADQYQSAINFLKSLRPQPREEEM